MLFYSIVVYAYLLEKDVIVQSSLFDSRILKFTECWVADFYLEGGHIWKGSVPVEMGESNAKRNILL